MKYFLESNDLIVIPDLSNKKNIIDNAYNINQIDMLNNIDNLTNKNSKYFN